MRAGIRSAVTLLPFRRHAYPSMSKQLRQLICLDLDGPILDVSDRYYRVYSDTLRSIGKQPVGEEAYWNKKRERISEPEILAASGVRDGELIQAYLKQRAERIESPEYLRFDRVWPGTADALKVLRSGAELTLVTMRQSVDQLNRQLDRTGLSDSFDCVLAGPAELRGASRAERKAQLVRAHYGQDDLSGWFVGDTETDIRAGRLLGIRTLAITFGIRTVEHLEAVAPDLVLHSPAEFHRWARNITD